MSFGFSVGDFIVGLQIANEIYRTYGNTDHNASTEFKRFVEEFGRFRELLESHSGPLDGRADLGPGYADTVAACRAFVDKHTALTGKDRSALGRLKLAFHTLQWPAEREQVERLRAQYMSYVQFDHFRTSQATLKTSQDTLKAVLKLTENLDHYLTVNVHTRPVQLDVTTLELHKERIEWPTALSNLLRHLDSGTDITRDLADLEKALDLGEISRTNIGVDNKTSLIRKLSERIDNLAKRERGKAAELSGSDSGREAPAVNHDPALRGLSDLQEFISNSLLRHNPPPRTQSDVDPSSVHHDVNVKCQGILPKACKVEIYRNRNNDVHHIKSIGHDGQLVVEHVLASDSTTPWTHHSCSFTDDPQLARTVYFRGQHKITTQQGSQPRRPMMKSPSYIFTHTEPMEQFQSDLILKTYVKGFDTQRITSRRGCESDSEVIRIFQDPTTSLRSLLYYSNARSNALEKGAHDFGLSLFVSRTKSINDKTIKITFASAAHKSSIFGRRTSVSTAGSGNASAPLESKLQYLEIAFSTISDREGFLTEYRLAFPSTSTPPSRPPSVSYATSPVLDPHQLSSSSFRNFSFHSRSSSTSNATAAAAELGALQRNPSSVGGASSASSSTAHTTPELSGITLSGRTWNHGVAELIAGAGGSTTRQPPRQALHELPLSSSPRSTHPDTIASPASLQASYLPPSLPPLELPGSLVEAEAEDEAEAEPEPSELGA
ncbi:MAG: hypothetical protein M1838_003772 [Thelocarpon superellum]|nr:MAG: hypothetical protein M1838_003772 [Thelocarpon superellum]